MSAITHPLEFYASAFAEEPSQVLQIPDGATLGEWLAANVDGFDPDLDSVSYSIPLDSPVHGRVIADMVPEGWRYIVDPQTSVQVTGSCPS